MKLEIACAVRPDQPARLTAACRSYVNHDVYFFSDEKCRKSFETDPFRFCGEVTDPVTNARFRPGRLSPQRRHKKRLYVFANAQTAAKFRADPAHYAERHHPPMATPVQTSAGKDPAAAGT